MEGQASGTPFLIAGYLITWAVLVWYLWRLNRRSLQARRALDFAGATRPPIETQEPNDE
jgi:CcmD family protein